MLALGFYLAPTFSTFPELSEWTLPGVFCIKRSQGRVRKKRRAISDKRGASSAGSIGLWGKNRSQVIKKHLLHHQVQQLLTPMQHSETVKLVSSVHRSDTSPSCNIYSTVCERENAPASSWFSVLPFNKIYVYFL